jgi:hypothetical protein
MHNSGIEPTVNTLRVLPVAHTHRFSYPISFTRLSTGFSYFFFFLPFLASGIIMVIRSFGVH